MSCARPKTAWRSRFGPQMVFQSYMGIPDTRVELPCGRCLLCMQRRVSDWVVRMVHEAKAHEQSCCITLSYDDEHLPANAELCPADVSKFIRRLRAYLKREFGIKVRYFYAGEYGTVNGRPHYHFVLFGFSFLHDRTRVTHYLNPSVKYTSPTLEKLWGNGMVDIGDVTESTARYVMKYVLKADIGKPGYDPHIIRSVRALPRLVEVVPFHRQSTKPGLGFSFMQDYMSELYGSDVAMLKTGTGVKRFSVPRYYDVKLRQLEPDSYEFVKERRVSRALKRPIDPARVAAKHEIMRLQLEKAARGES